MHSRWTRRHVLAGAGAAIAGLAGCIGGSDDEDGGDGGADDGSTGRDGAGDGNTDSDDSGGNGSNSDGSDDDAGGGTSGDGEEFDLREANVTDVTVEEAGDREFRISVTLYHDDEGEDGYANWWAVETKGVEELGRRELTHAHGTEEFTRSETIEIPEGVSCAVVRGHDQTHGYGGQAMLVSVPGGETEPLQQGSEPDAFADAGCP